MTNTYTYGNPYPLNPVWLYVLTHYCHHHQQQQQQQGQHSQEGYTLATNP
jgi:hypothetical protein